MSESKKIDSIIQGMRRIAVVGLSSNPDKPSYEVAEWLQHAGYEIIPVNPEGETILGQKVYRDLASIPGDLDVVDVFRRPDAVLPIAEQVAQRGGVKAFWMQLGVRNDAAARLLEEHGVTVVQDHCLKVETGRRR
jgi:predicted CoA-binding protein